MVKTLPVDIPVYLAITDNRPSFSKFSKFENVKFLLQQKLVFMVVGTPTTLDPRLAHRLLVAQPTSADAIIYF